LVRILFAQPVKYLILPILLSFWGAYFLADLSRAMYIHRVAIDANQANARGDWL
jgi:hypothetical protein